MEDHGGDAAPSVTTGGDNGLGDGGAGNIKIEVSFGDNNFDVFTTPQSTFGDLKCVIAKATGLDPKAQNLLFRGKEKDDHESLQMAGVKDNAKVILIENTPTKNEDLEKVEKIKENVGEVSRGPEDVNQVISIENTPTKNEDLEIVEEIKENVREVSRGLEAVYRVREENNQFEEQVVSLETVVCSGTQVADKDFIFLTEMLMRQVLKLDGIEAEGEGRIQRKLEVRRVQGLVEKLDNLRVKNANLTSNVPDEPPLPSSSKVDQECE